MNCLDILLYLCAVLLHLFGALYNCLKILFHQRYCDWLFLFKYRQLKGCMSDQLLISQYLYLDVFFSLVCF